MLFDALAHLHDPRLQQALAGMLREAASAGVGDIVCGNARGPLDAPGPLRLWRAVGVHPREVTPAWQAQVATVVAALAADDPALMALGEVGLDSRDGTPPDALQEAAFVAQLQLARAHHLPLIVHCVGRAGRLSELMKTHGAPEAGFVLHAFTGSAEMVPQWVALGAMFSFGGLVTRPEAKKCRKAAAAVPEDRLLIESDAPDMPVHGWEGPAAPAMLPRILAVLAELRGVSPTTLARATAQNARRLYKTPPPRKTEPV